jgi:hypothetical protein
MALTLTLTDSGPVGIGSNSTLSSERNGGKLARSVSCTICFGGAWDVFFLQPLNDTVATKNTTINKMYLTFLSIFISFVCWLPANNDYTVCIKRETQTVSFCIRSSRFFFPFFNILLS